MEAVKFSPQAHAILSTLTGREASDIYRAVVRLGDDPSSGDSSVQLQSRGDLGDVYALRVDDYRVIIKRTKEEPPALEVTDIISREAVQSYRDALARAAA